MSVIFFNEHTNYANSWMMNGQMMNELEIICLFIVQLRGLVQSGYY